MNDKRYCTYDDTKCIFHEFYTKFDVIGDSAMVGGHRAGELSFHMAVVEPVEGDSKGRVWHVPSQKIKFLPVKAGYYSKWISDDYWEIQEYNEQGLEVSNSDGHGRTWEES